MISSSEYNRDTGTLGLNNYEPDNSSDDDTDIVEPV